MSKELLTTSLEDAHALPESDASRKWVYMRWVPVGEKATTRPPVPVRRSVGGNTIAKRATRASGGGLWFATKRVATRPPKIRPPTPTATGQRHFIFSELRETSTLPLPGSDRNSFDLMKSQKEEFASLFRLYEACKTRRQLRAGSTAAATRKKPSSTGRWHSLSRRFSRSTKNGFSQPLATFERSYKIRYINFSIVVSSIEVSAGRGAQNVDASFW